MIDRIGSRWFCGGWCFGCWVLGVGCWMYGICRVLELSWIHEKDFCDCAMSVIRGHSIHPMIQTFSSLIYDYETAGRRNVEVMFPR